MNNINNPLKYKNYFSYLFSNAKHTSLAQRIRHVYSFLRKYILAGRIFRYIRIIFFWLQTGTYFLLVSTVLLFLIPVILLSVLSFCVYRNIMHKRYNSYFLKVLKNHSVCIIFNETEKDITNRCNNCFIKFYVVTNPFTPFKNCVKMIDRDTFLISMSYFFSLRKHVLEKTKTEVFYEKREV